jgi:hypothetical protein
MVIKGGSLQPRMGGPITAWDPSCEFLGASEIIGLPSRRIVAMMAGQ